MNAVRGVVNYIMDRLLPADGVPSQALRPLPEALEQARQEWLTACAYFDSVADPTLVDHAIYLVQAAERRHSYLLRLARAAPSYRPGEPGVPDPNRPPGRPTGPPIPGRPGQPAWRA